MILHKKLTSKEVLEIVIAKAAEFLPQNIKGKFDATYNEDGIDIVFTEKLAKEDIS